MTDERDRPAVTVGEAVARAVSMFKNSSSSIPDPHREAIWLLAELLKVSEVEIRTSWGKKLDNALVQEFIFWAARRAAGEPASYISGTCSFWGHKFTVGPGVLVPRPETELLVQDVLDRLGGEKGLKLLDVGTGSGCIAISLALEKPKWMVVACDKSVRALGYAAKNRRRLGARNMHLLASDLGEAVGMRFGAVVANLPYVDPEYLSSCPPELLWEPREALDGGGDHGAALLLRFIRQLPRLLAPLGLAWLELDPRQVRLVERAVDEEPHLDLDGVVADVFGDPRAVRIRASGSACEGISPPPSTHT